MTSPPIATWLDVLWAAVCTRAAQPIKGLLLPPDRVSEIATRIFEDFLSEGGEPAPSLNNMLAVLTSPVRNETLKAVAADRASQKNPDLYRDPDFSFWTHNPNLNQLRIRDSSGALKSSEWSRAEPILWNRVGPIYNKLKINQNDARDVYAETIGQFLKAEPNSEKCPMRQMHVFEELPRLFAVVAERRAISWLRKVTTLKNQPNTSGISLDDPDLGLVDQLKEPRSLATDSPFANTSFDEIRAACEPALTPARWQLLEMLFIDGTTTREQLVKDPTLLEELGLPFKGSRSTLIRRVNEAISKSLSDLGTALSRTDV